MKSHERAISSKYELSQKDDHLIESDSDSDEELRRREEFEIKKILIECIRLFIV